MLDGQPDKALGYLDSAMEIQSDLPQGPLFMGIALGRLGRWAESERMILKAMAMEPDNPGCHGYLAFAYARQDKKDLAARVYADLCQRFPDWSNQFNEFALNLVTKAAVQDQKMAEEMALQICEATIYKEPRYLDTLAAVQAAGGDFARARETAGTALRLARDPALVRQLRERLRLYEQRQPLRFETNKSRG